MSEWTDAQRKTVEGIGTGLLWNDGVPCECGPDAIVTRKERKYSDTMVYRHRCTECGQEFSTWTEG